MNYLITARLWLEANVGPWAPWALLTFAIWLGAWATRRYLPSVWSIPAQLGPKGETLSNLWQALPSLLAGALMEATTTGDYANAWRGALFGALAPVWHHLLKKAPVSYLGALGSTDEAKDKS